MPCAGGELLTGPVGRTGSEEGVAGDARSASPVASTAPATGAGGEACCSSAGAVVSGRAASSCYRYKIKGLSHIWIQIKLTDCSIPL